MNRKLFFIPLLVLSVLPTSCKDNSLGADCSSGDLSEIEAYKLTTGNWNLVSIKSGWTSEITKPLIPTTLAVDDSQQAIILEAGKEVVRFYVTLTKAGTSLVYKTSDASNNSALVPPSGIFKVCNKQLIFDATYVDGPQFVYEKI